MRITEQQDAQKIGRRISRKTSDNQTAMADVASPIPLKATPKRR
jgi:hypothetical protein